VAPATTWECGKPDVPVPRPRTRRALYRMPELQLSDSEEYNDEASDDGDRDLANPIGIKHLY
jgi:hypothetical protein